MNEQDQRARPGLSKPGSGLDPGTKAGGYLIEELIASGGCGAVYRAHDPAHGRSVAVKVLHPELAHSPKGLVRFEQEAKAVQLLRHPGFVEIYDLGKLDDGRPYFVMELLPGSDLKAYLRANGRLTTVEAQAILEPLCMAVSVAHAKGIIHRDLKASNVFLMAGNPQRRVVLLDFGVAKLLESPHTHLTTSHHLLGTPTCMSPEQIRGGTIDDRTDVYGLGALTYEMLTGEPPFVAESSSAVQHLHLHCTPVAPSLLANLPPSVDDVIVHALSKDPNHRPSSVADFLAAYRGALKTDLHPADRPQGDPALALALHVEVRPTETALKRFDAGVARQMGDMLLRACRRLRECGFHIASETGSSALLVYWLGARPDADLALRERSIRVAHDLFADLQTPAYRQVAHLNICLRVGSALAQGDRATGGEIMQLGDWVPDLDWAGVACSPDLLEGLSLRTVPLEGAPHLRQLDAGLGLVGPVSPE